jgi:hypothetical protein
MLLALIVQVLQVISYFSFEQNFSSTSTQVLNIFDGIFIYSLYYMMCLCAPVDIAKKELLRTNLKFSGMIFGVMCGIQYLLQALILDPVVGHHLNKDFFENKPEFYSMNAIKISCTVIAFLSIFRIVKEEMMELSTFKRNVDADETSINRKTRKTRMTDIDMAANMALSQKLYADFGEDETEDQDFEVTDLRNDHIQTVLREHKGDPTRTMTVDSRTEHQ